MTPALTAGLLMAVLLLMAVAVSTHPWWRAKAGTRQNRRAANVAAYRLRVAEIEAETASGMIPAEEAAALRAELDARLLTDADGTEPELVAKAERRPLSVLVVASLLGMFAIAWYAVGGSWRVQQEIASAPPPAAAPAIDPQVVAMVDKLAERLQQKPDDPTGWTMLGRSYVVMSRYAEAAAAYAEARSRTPTPTAELLADEGEAIAFANGQDVSGESAALFDAALKLDPDYSKALWYGGLGSAVAGDYATAKARWQRLLAKNDLAPEMRSALQERMTTLEQAIAANGVNPAAAEAGAVAAQPPAAAGDAESAAGPAISLKVKVSLAPELASKVPAGATLFVFAKAASGPPMPLAVQRLPGATLPLEVSLDESMAMAPGLSLSRFEQYVITARLSAAGSVQAQPGDLEGRIEATQAQSGGKALTLVIDKQLP